MNPTLEVIEKRRSIRVYDPAPLSEAEQDAILHAAMRAPYRRGDDALHDHRSQRSGHQRQAG